MPRLIARMVIWDLAKVTALSLVGISSLLMLVGAMVEAARNGLDPFRVMLLMPYLIPPTLPYTLPTCLLFACTVVYGGLNNHNEIVPLKAGGISATRMLWPAIALAAALAFLGIYLADKFIPACNRKVTEMILSDLQSAVYAYLKHRGSISEFGFPYEIVVQNVRDDRLIRPIFKQRSTQGGPEARNARDAVIQAEEATLQVVPGDGDASEPEIVIRLFNGVATYGDSTVHFRERPERIPIPKSLSKDKQDKTEGLSFTGLRARAAGRGRQAGRVDCEFALQSCALALSGDVAGIAKNVDTRQEEAQRHRRKSREAGAEVHLRVAQSFAVIPFVLVGCPISLMLRRREFLHTFFLCFLPIITLFYPAMILSFNVYKEGHGSLLPTLWGPLLVMCLIAVPMIRHVRRY